jgi:hypothetical protein
MRVLCHDPFHRCFECEDPGASSKRNRQKRQSLIEANETNRYAQGRIFAYGLGLAVESNEADKSETSPGQSFVQTRGRV